MSPVTTEALNKVQSAESAVEAAITWWLAALETPRYESNDSPELAVIATRAQLLRPSYSEAALTQFREIMREDLTRLVAVPDGYTRSRTVTLGVDYEPYAHLRFYASHAGLPTDQLSWPSKTTMQVNFDEVIVGVGYNEPQTVWRRTR